MLIFLDHMCIIFHVLPSEWTETWHWWNREPSRWSWHLRRSRHLWWTFLFILSFELKVIHNTSFVVEEICCCLNFQFHLHVCLLELHELKVQILQPENKWQKPSWFSISFQRFQKVIFRISSIVFSLIQTTENLHFASVYILIIWVDVSLTKIKLISWQFWNNIKSHCSLQLINTFATISLLFSS